MERTAHLKTLHLCLLWGFLAQGILGLALSERASASPQGYPTPMIQVIPSPPLVLSREDLKPGSDGVSPSSALQSWAEINSEHLPWVDAIPPLADDDSLENSDPIVALGGYKRETIGKLLLQIANFAREFAGRADPYMHSDFRADFLHALGKEWPGFAWILEAGRSSYEIPGKSAIREGGGLGMQIPLVGDRVLALKDGQGQLVLRVLPIAGNFERFSIGDDPNTRIDSPDSGIILRPATEIAGGYLKNGVRPAFRFLVQPRINEPNEIRMLAEVSINFDIPVNDPMLKNISIVPRCVVDYSTETFLARTVPNDQIRQAYRNADRLAMCSLSAEFAFGL